MLTNYDGTAISYDSIGNPTNWRNSSSLTWDGRTLTSQTLTNGNSITYKYNSDGIRTQKRVFDDISSAYITHDYVLDGSKILSETVTDNAYYNSYTLYYIYDAAGSITGLHYNNQPYYFQKNIQGDILCILDRTGTAVVEYTYDAWGNILSVTGSMASTLGQYNPFRYRGYYYDIETGLYYLNSRYYDPQVGRFINADGVSLFGYECQSIDQYNLYAYCWNNPVNSQDDMGCFTKKLFAKIVVTVVVYVGVKIVIPEIIKTINYSNNQTAQDNLPSGYIDNQSKHYYMKMGIKGADWNGCGWIAVYNAMIMLGNQQQAADVIRYFDGSGRTLLYGYFGANPFAVKSYFVMQGYSVSNNLFPFVYPINMEERAQSATACILLYIHSEAAHYVAFRWNGKKYEVYNVSVNSFTDIGTFLQKVNGTLVYIWFIE